MKFDNVLEMIENPTLNAYLAQIKDLQAQLKNADPKQKIELTRQINALRQTINKVKQEQAAELAKKQQELAQANNTVV
ncbi:MAG TPA: hypothetical protein P5277_05170 [Candidatus Paceibacterota bacterium]|nr:hypothetical protein [Candidatus Paceibacterota bacterium]